MKVQIRRLIRQVAWAVEHPGSRLERLGATLTLVCLPEFGQVHLLGDLLRVLSQVLALIAAVELTHKLDRSLEGRVTRHLGQLLYCLRQHFVDLEQQECVLAEQLAGEVLVLVVVHQVVVVRVADV